MAWSMTTKTDTSNFTKMAEIRAHLKNSAEFKDKNDDIFPEDVVIPSVKSSVKKPARKQPVKKLTKQEAVNLSDNYSTEENSSSKSRSQNIDTVNNDDSGEDDVNCCNNSTVQSDISDTKVATDMIVKDLKKIIARVSAIASVIEDVQASSITRNFTALNKSVNTLYDLVSEGKSLVTRKKVKTCKK
ncbi:late transcription factor VLTF-4 [Yokapox virus]|uniref:Late transcription factor VLTF-4 n=1 Tax=Yokapox virus TaxID=1076255 RepID=G3EIG1_9POXV|nr:late transcription factor VLTF-4 [Yokapox virus]AEN03672.1 late transcription factor VLTF-4 [Yokapox virus]